MAADAVAAPPRVTPTPTPDYILHAAELSHQIDQSGGSGSVARKFGPQAVVILLTALRDGLHYEPACRLAGVSYEAFRVWCRRGEDEAEDGPYATFACAVKLAEAEAEAESVRYVRAAQRDPRFWAAGMTFLERRHPDRWKRQDGPIQVNVGISVGIGATDDSRRGLLPDIVIAQIRPDNGVRPSLGTGEDQVQSFALPLSLSPDPHNT